MKNFKGKALAFALAGSMVFSSMTSAFANEVTNVNKLGILQSLDLIKGNGANDPNYASSQMERYQNFVMLLRLQGLEDEMDAFQVDANTETFADAATMHNYEKKLAAFLKAHPELGVQGYEDGSLKPYQNITAKEYLKTMLDALGYEYNVDFTWSGDAGVLETAEAIGLISDASAIDGNAQITVNQAAAFTYDALAMAPKGETLTLGEKLGKPVVVTAKITLDEIASTATTNSITVSGTATGLDTVTVNGEEVAVVDGAFEATVDLVNGNNTITVAGEGVDAQTVTVAYNDVDAPEVVSVSSLGLKQVEVVFNEALDKDTAEDANNYEGFAKAELQADKKTVVLTLSSSVEQGKKVKFDIEDIKDLNDNRMEKVTKEVTMVDRAIPEISSVEVLGNQTIKVTFSELVQAEKSDFEVVNADGETAERISDIVMDGRTVKVNLRKSLPAGDYTFKASGVEDFAGFLIYSQEFDITVMEDEDAPTAEFISATDTKVVVEFNEEFKTEADDIKAEWEAGSKSGKFSATLTEIDDTNKKLVTFKLASGDTLPLSGATIKIYNVEDYYGNKVVEDKAIELTVNRYDIELDTTRPEIESYEQDGKNAFIIYFTEDITGGDIDVYDTDGDRISSNFSVDATDKNKVKVSLSDSGDLDGTFTVEIDEFKDTSTQNNEMIPTAFDIELSDNDLTDDVTKYKARFEDPADHVSQVIFIQYPEKMDANSVENETNYRVQYGNKWADLHRDAEIELLEDDKTVKISLEDWFDNDGVTPDTVTGIQLMNVVDNNGNELDGIVWIQSTGLGTVNNAQVLSITAPQITAAKATDKNKVVLTVNGSIDADTIDEEDIYFYAGTLPNADALYYVESMSYSSDDNELTLMMEDELPADLANITLRLSSEDTNGEVYTANVFGEELELGSSFNASQITDEIKPELTVVGSVYQVNDNETFAKSGAYVVFEANEAIKFLGNAVSGAANVDHTDSTTVGDMVAHKDSTNATEQLFRKAFKATMNGDDLEIKSVFAYAGALNNDSAPGYKFNTLGKQYIALYIEKDANEDWIGEDIDVTFNSISVANFTISDLQDNILKNLDDEDNTNTTTTEVK